MDIFTLLDEIQTIARIGLHHAENPYDRERYERLHQIATRGYAEHLALTEDAVADRFAREVGYITPKVGADAAIFDARERLLVERRSDDGRWGLISGWVDPGESPAETVVREAREETGLEIAVRELVDVLGRPASATNGPHAAVSVIFLCAVVGGEQRLSHEVLDLAWRHIDDIEAWHGDHERFARRALVAHREAAPHGAAQEIAGQ